MGKSKSRNRQKNRPGPTSKPIKPPTDPELAAIREQRILPVLKDLQSADLKTRSAAASAISNIIEDTKCRKLLLREKIVKILFEQTLTDSSLETRSAGWGILRNLALEEEADFCIHLYRQDILTAIEGTVKTIIQTIESQDVPFTKLPKPQQSLAWGLTSSIVSLISSLSEAQDEIVEAISKLSTITNFLFGLLSFDSTPNDVQNEVLSCLMALTEDNKPLIQQITEKDAWLKKLMTLKASGVLAVPACGVLHNIFTAMGWSDHNMPFEGVSDAALISTLVTSLEIDRSHNGTNGNASYSSPDQILQLALEITASIATSLQEALEHSHEKAFEGFDDPPEDLDEIDADEDINIDGEEGDEEGDHEMNDEDIEADMDLVTGGGPEDDDSTGEEPTLDLLVRNAAPKILALALPDGSGSEGIKNAALSTLNNIAWTVSSIDFSTGHLDSLKKFWSSLAQQTWDQIISLVLASNTADIELASTVTSLAWAISRSVQGKITLKPEEPQKFMALYQASKTLPPTSTGDSKKTDTEDAFQSLGVKSIGVLGSLALSPAPIPLNRQIGVFLLTILSALPETPAADTVEALNQLFDIYADSSYAFDEPVFWGDDFYKHLEDIAPKAKKMAKSIDKRKHEELRARADEAVLNLGRFLRYKKGEKEKSNL
ncbi:hypothetical protein G7Y89_g1920 [Cudoniella acicularis]|uniref:SYO1-like TPR repeats domain-containing protein n=1 Tax=Cudoniella acicularis TaxID=354080 RepID=A0A8H4RUA8_9HELO|nr:hypothetical protein G7Y89_g1920 [Cudoniella acicularis]